jgi:uncharacterized damage-inducible protein DinB
MSQFQILLAEFEHEAKTTRRFLESLPSGSLSWKPHPKSHSAGELAHHIASVPGTIVRIAAAGGAELPRVGWPEPTSVDAILRTFEESVGAVRSVLPTFTDEAMGGTVTLTRDGQVVLAMPRAAFLRMVMLNHCYHHRGQFGVYLRLLGAKVPSAYGPSGDEMGPGQ